MAADIKSQFPSFLPSSSNHVEGHALLCHPELKINSAEQQLIQRFSRHSHPHADKNDVHNAYTTLLESTRNKTLSPNALLYFANQCYHYWQAVLPSASQLA